MISAALLKNMYIFKNLSPTQLDFITRICVFKVYEEDEDVFVQGSLADALYVIGNGEVVVHQKIRNGGNLEITSLGPGSHFGEMAFIDGEKRSASVTAKEKTEIFIIPFDELSDIVKMNQDIAAVIYKSLAVFLCGRLRLTTNDLSKLEESSIPLF